MRLCVLTLCALLALISIPGCGGVKLAPPPASAGAIPPTTDNAIVAGLSALQTAAIALGPFDGIPPADTTTIVNAVAAITQVVIAAKAGWVSAVDIALAKLPGQLSPSTAATLQPWLDGIQSAIGAAYGAGQS